MDDGFIGSPFDGGLGRGHCFLISSLYEHIKDNPNARHPIINNRLITNVQRITIYFKYVYTLGLPSDQDMPRSILDQNMFVAGMFKLIVLWRSRASRAASAGQSTREHRARIREIKRFLDQRYAGWRELFTEMMGAF
jgi:hypothetical protein